MSHILKLLKQVKLLFEEEIKDSLLYKQKDQFMIKIFSSCNIYWIKSEITINYVCTWILEVITNVLLKYSLASLASSSVLYPIKANCLKTPALLYFICRSVIVPLAAKTSRSFFSVI